MYLVLKNGDDTIGSPTPLKFNMELENDGLEDVSPFPGVKTLRFQPLVLPGVGFQGFLGGGFKHFLFSTLFGEEPHFD